MTLYYKLDEKEQTSDLTISMCASVIATGMEAVTMAMKLRGELKHPPSAAFYINPGREENAGTWCAVFSPIWDGDNKPDRTCEVVFYEFTTREKAADFAVALANTVKDMAGHMFRATAVD